MAEDPARRGCGPLSDWRRVTQLRQPRPRGDSGLDLRGFGTLMEAMREVARGGPVDEVGRELVVGVLGGLGPEATHDFLGKLLAATGARRDQEHLHVLIDCNPKVANRNEAIAGTGPSPGPALAAMAGRLERAGADFLVMPCNTASHWQAEIEAASRLPFVGIVLETAAALERDHPGIRRIGVLAAGGCRQARLYERALEPQGIAAVLLDDDRQKQFMALLYRIKAGERGPGIREAMRALALRLLADGAEAVIAGCTEVPLVLGQDELPLPFVDSTAVLARATVDYAKGRRPLPGRTPGALGGSSLSGFPR